MNLKNNKVRAVIVAGTAVLAVAIGGVFLANHEDTETKKPDTSKTEETPTSYPAPVNLEFWQNRQWDGPKESMVTQPVRDAVDEELAGSGFARTTESTLPSEASGFTSDPAEASTEDGGPNPFYSYWTDASFKAQSHLLLEALVNPVFGGWAEHQAPGEAGNLSEADFTGVFTDRFLSQSRIDWPVVADWSGNAYGNPDIVVSGGAYWFGDVQSYDASWKWDEKSMSYRVAGTYKVVYKARLSDGSVVSKDGVLRLTFVPAPTTVADSGGFRVQVDEASLRMGS